MRLIVNCITLVRAPVIVLLVLPVFSTGWDSPKFLFWLYVIGLLSHGLDGLVGNWLKPKPRRYHEDEEVWHVLDTMVLSLGLQLAAAIALFHELGTAWWFAAMILIAYVIVTALIEFRYIQEREARSKKYVPITLYGSAVVWLGLGGALAYQAFGTPKSVVYAICGMGIFGVLHALLHPTVWNRWFEKAKGEC